MNILVTGCAGFIGSQISRLLLSQEHTVVGIDSITDAYDPRLKQHRIAKLIDQARFYYHCSDILNQKNLSSIFTDRKIDAVINLAAKAGVRQSLEDPWSYYQTNVAGTLGLLMECRDNGVDKFVLSSTSSVYGAGACPFREDSPTDLPLSPYAASKKAAEILCYTFHKLYGIDTSIMRYFTVYGPAGRPDMSIFRFIRWIVEGNQVLVYGDGTQKRDFTFVDDIAKGTIAALKPVGFEAFNLGDDDPKSLQSVIQTIESILSKTARIEYHPSNPADVAATWAQISKAKSHLDWEPQMAFKAGLEKTIDWYLDNREWASQINL